MSKPKIINIVGPTASGKTSLSIKVAKHFNGEVISADSRQVYRGLNIGTGKVTAAEMEGVPHHLLNVAEVTDTYTAADFAKDAAAAVDDIVNRGRCPIIAGGSFFYTDALLYPSTLPEVPPNPNLRSALAALSTEVLFDTLATQDPRRASEIDPQNRRRLIRALEIVNALGIVPEETKRDSPYDTLTIGIKVEKDALRAKFAARITSWLAADFASETRWLMETVSPERFREFGFEYTLMQSHLSGELSETELIEKFIEKNWQYAKRQLTWLKRDDTILWHTPDETKEIFTHITDFLFTP